MSSELSDAENKECLVLQEFFENVCGKCYNHIAGYWWLIYQTSRIWLIQRYSALIPICGISHSRCVVFKKDFRLIKTKLHIKCYNLQNWTKYAMYLNCQVHSFYYSDKDSTLGFWLVWIMADFQDLWLLYRTIDKLIFGKPSVSIVCYLTLQNRYLNHT